ncbi:unnamed protein product, partial [Didymodactylos carnosus]
LSEYYEKAKRTVLSVLRKNILLSTTNSQQGNLQIQNQPPPRYLSSEYLCGSSLAGELAIFDYISSAVVSQQQQQTNLNKSISLSQSRSQTFLSKIQNGESNDDAPTLEFEDEYTDFLDMEVDIESASMYGDDDLFIKTDMPIWMLYLHKKFSDPTTHTNYFYYVSLFIPILYLNHIQDFG